MGLSRRGFLYTAAALGLSATGYGFVWESKWLELTFTRIPVPRFQGERPVRILHMSDLHWSPFDSLVYLKRAFELGLSAKPDLACLTGDFVSVGNDYTLDRYRSTLEFLSSSVPTYGVLGNHDGGLWSQERGGFHTEEPIHNLFEDSGIPILSNRRTQFSAKGRKLNLVGVPDLWSGDTDPESAFQGGPPLDSDLTIVLAHNPDSKDLMSRYEWQLMLCGHTHGGQIRVPLVGAPYAPVQDRRYIAGLNPWGDRLIYTTRGVGSIYGTRFSCRPEVSILDLT